MEAIQFSPQEHFYSARQTAYLIDAQYRCQVNNLLEQKKVDNKLILTLIVVGSLVFIVGSIIMAIQDRKKEKESFNNYNNK